MKIINFLIIFIVLIINVSFISAMEEIGCPISTAYFIGEDGNLYECRSGYDLEKFDWYIKTDGGKFSIMPQSLQYNLTEAWIELGFNITGREDAIKSYNLNLKSYSNKTIMFGIPKENSFFKLNDNYYKNVMPLSTSFLEFDYVNSQIIAANFMVNKIGGNYTFGNNSFYAPPNSKVIFDKESGFKIKINDGSDLSGFFSLFNFNGEYPTIIEGKDIRFPNGLNLEYGRVDVSNKGYSLEYGNALYKQNSIQVGRNGGKVLLANKDMDLSDYEGNWIKQSDNSLEIQSSNEGFINIEFLENHEILNTDSRDKMSALVKNGDGLEIATRNTLIPIVNHKSSERGETIIENDKFNFIIDKNEFKVNPPSSLESYDFSNKYQSVALEVKSDSLNADTKLRINSYRQFQVLSNDDERLVTYNEYELPVSARIKDNELQSIEQLRKKYPELKLKVNELGAFNEENFPPYLLYMTDNFLETYPDAVEDLDAIEYSSIKNAAMTTHTSTLLVGLKSYETNRSYLVRDNNGPMQTLRHEYEHQLDNIIRRREFNSMRDLNVPSLNALLDSRIEIQKIVDIGDDKSFTDKNISDIEILIQNEYSKLYPDEKTLQQLYNDVVQDGIKKLPRSKTVNKELKMVVDEINEYYGDNKLNVILASSKYETDVIDYVRNLESIKYKYGDLSRDDVSNIFNSNELNIEAAKALYYSAKEEADRSGEEVNEDIKDLWGVYSRVGKLESTFDIGYITRMYNSIPNDPDTKHLKDMIDNSLESNIGLRSYQLYGDENKREVSSLIAEQTTESLIMKVNSANRAISNTYKKLIQIEFDSGKYSIMEYQVVMGSGYCKDANCLDKRCIEYKGLCCEDYPTSPNC